jgi:hypothetical protein
MINASLRFVINLLNTVLLCIVIKKTFLERILLKRVAPNSWREIENILLSIKELQKQVESPEKKTVNSKDGYEKK